jgi:hypothetical protein
VQGFQGKSFIKTLLLPHLQKREAKKEEVVDTTELLSLTSPTKKNKGAAPPSGEATPVKYMPIM